MPEPVPQKPIRGYSFTGLSAGNPTAQQPGDRLDQEYDRIADALGDTIDFTRQAVADDGRVKLEALPVAELGAIIASTPEEPYTPATNALAVLTPAADRVPYFTGTGTAALAALTSAARALLDDASFTDMLATLGIVSGSNANGRFLRIGGVLICWAEIQSVSGADATWTFPQPFSSGSHLVCLGSVQTGAPPSGAWEVGFGVIGTTSATFGAYNGTLAGGRDAVPCMLFAIGAA